MAKAKSVTDPLDAAHFRGHPRHDGGFTPPRWGWLDELGDEAYAVCDARDSYKKTPLERARLNAFAAIHAFRARLWPGH
jgi:hypothetical protein